MLPVERLAQVSDLRSSFVLGPEIADAFAEDCFKHAGVEYAGLIEEPAEKLAEMAYESSFSKPKSNLMETPPTRSLAPHTGSNNSVRLYWISRPGFAAGKAIQEDRC
jgi:hypothetical protein